MTSVGVKQFYHLTKPGIVRANIITAAAGYIFIAGANTSFYTLFGVLLGTHALVSAGCVFNNILDSKIDSLMERTKNRAIPSGRITKKAAAAFGIVLVLIGTLSLLFLTNTLTLLIGLAGLFSYVGLYTYAKKHTMYATEIGTIPGAASIVAGATAASNELSLAAIMLFIIMVAWQIPHFYGIALMRHADYVKAKIPTVITRMGARKTQIISTFYMTLFISSCLILYIVANLSLLYVFGIITIATLWLSLAVKNRSNDPVKWGKNVFLGSLVSLLVFCLLITAEGFLTNSRL